MPTFRMKTGEILEEQYINSPGNGRRQYLNGENNNLRYRCKPNKRIL